MESDLSDGSIGLTARLNAGGKQKQPDDGMQFDSAASFRRAN